MEFHSSEIAPEMRNKGLSAAETQNERNMVQVGLMMRYPEGDMAWSKRYAKAFGQLFVTSDFVELVQEAHFSEEGDAKNAAYVRIQDVLERAVQDHPEWIEQDEEAA